MRGTGCFLLGAAAGIALAWVHRRYTLGV